MFIADGDNNRIVKYYANTSTGILVAGSLTAGSSASLLDEPKGIAVDDMGNLYVGDTSNNRIQKFPPGSTVAAILLLFQFQKMNHFRLQPQSPKVTQLIHLVLRAICTSTVIMKFM